MKLTPVKYDEIKGTKNYAVLKEFMEMDVDCVLVESGEHKGRTSLVSSLHNSIKRFNFNIEVVTRNGSVYLVNLNRVKK